MVTPSLNKRSMPQQLKFILAYLDEQIATERGLNNNNRVKELLTARESILQKRKRLKIHVSLQ